MKSISLLLILFRISVLLSCEEKKVVALHTGVKMLDGYGDISGGIKLQNKIFEEFGDGAKNCVKFKIVVNAETGGDIDKVIAFLKTFPKYEEVSKIIEGGKAFYNKNPNIEIVLDSQFEISKEVVDLQIIGTPNYANSISLGNFLSEEIRRKAPVIGFQEPQGHSGFYLNGVRKSYSYGFPKETEVKQFYVTANQGVEGIGIPLSEDVYAPNLIKQDFIEKVKNDPNLTTISEYSGVSTNSSFQFHYFSKDSPKLFILQALVMNYANKDSIDKGMIFLQNVWKSKKYIEEYLTRNTSEIESLLKGYLIKDEGGQRIYPNQESIKKELESLKKFVLKDIDVKYYERLGNEYFREAQYFSDYFSYATGDHSYLDVLYSGNIPFNDLRNHKRSYILGFHNEMWKIFESKVVMNKIEKANYKNLFKYIFFGEKAGAVNNYTAKEYQAMFQTLESEIFKNQFFSSFSLFRKKHNSYPKITEILRKSFEMIQKNIALTDESFKHHIENGSSLTENNCIKSLSVE